MSVAIWVGYPRSYTPGRVRAPQFVVMHGTAGNEGPTSAESGAQYDKTRTDGTSCHYFVDSAGPALQEVPEGDRSHSALFHGNEIGIHIEICGLPQTREQWLDAVSYPTLVMAAALAREVCDRQGFELRLLSVDETRAAYYGKDHRPTGIVDHARVTAAFPEDGGNHEDMWDGFPWDVFMEMVVGDPPAQQGGVDDMLMVAKSGSGDTTKYWLGNGFCHRQLASEAEANNVITALKYFGAPDKATILAWGTATEEAIQAIIGPTPYLEAGGGGGGLSFDQAVEAARQGANQAEDS